MTALGGRWWCRWRRATAWVAACTFLLMSGCGVLHRHQTVGGVSSSEARLLFPQVGVGDGSGSHTPDGCLACLWGRAAVGGPLGTRVVLPRAVATRVCPAAAETFRSRLIPSSSLTRGPPTPSA